MEEKNNQRLMVVNKIGLTTKRADTAMKGKKEKVARQCRNQLEDLMEKFGDLHVD